MDVVDFSLGLCQLLSMLAALVWCWRQCSCAAIALLCAVFFVNAFLTDFTWSLNETGATWHQLFAGQVPGDLVRDFMFSGIMYVGVVMFLGLIIMVQGGKFVVAHDKANGG